MANEVDLLITGGEIVSSRGYRRGDVAISDGVIVDIGSELSYQATRRVEADGCFLLPGLFDVHNHPYYDEDLEQFSFAAAAGGLTGLMSFVVGHPASPDEHVDIIDAGQEFIDQVASTSYLDCGGHIILSERDEFGSAIPRLRALGYGTFKVFMAFPGTRMLSDEQIYVVMQRIVDVGGICMVHCENGSVITHLERALREAGKTDGLAYLASRPAELETEAVFRALSLALLAQCPTYIVHVSSGESMRVIGDFRRRTTLPIYAETCPHYLCLTGEEQVALGARAKISPPCRTAKDRDALWHDVVAGAIDTVGTDASGQLLAHNEVSGVDYLGGRFGIPGVEECVKVMTATAAAHGEDPLPLLARTMAERPAEIFRLPQKGTIAIGRDADIALFDPDQKWTIRASEQLGRSDYSLYEGLEGQGCIVWSCQRGRPVLVDGEVQSSPGSATFLRQA